MTVPFSVVDGEFVPESAREMLELQRPYGLQVDATGDPLRILTDENLLSEGASARSPTGGSP